MISLAKRLGINQTGTGYEVKWKVNAQLGRKADALAAVDKALEIDPKYEPAIKKKSYI